MKWNIIEKFLKIDSIKMICDQPQIQKNQFLKIDFFIFYPHIFLYNIFITKWNKQSILELVWM